MRMLTDQGTLAIAGYRGHVNVHLGKGATLRDPRGLLEGTGKSIRHVKVRTVADARGVGLRELIRQELRSGPRQLSIRTGTGKAILERVRKFCLALPEVIERRSHGTPTFFFRDKKQFAQVWQGHHEDTGLALWCAAPSGAQQTLVKSDPGRFFVPPYVGGRGWLGVRLDRGIATKELRAIVADAYADVAGRQASARSARSG